MPIWNKIGIQNRNSPLIEHLSFFHDHTMILIIAITILTLFLIIISIKIVNFNRFLLESHQTEIFWTSVPACLLVFIALPSMKTLYIMEEMVTPIITIKAIGYQWYWSYEYSNLMKKMITSTIESSNKIRLRINSNNLIIPTITPTRVLVTSKDVLHSWTIPSLGLKADATPGRINQTIVISKRPGIMMGQCSEICGAGHRFMPIVIERPIINKFVKILYFKWPIWSNDLLSHIKVYTLKYLVKITWRCHL